VRKSARKKEKAPGEERGGIKPGFDERKSTSRIAGMIFTERPASQTGARREREGIDGNLREKRENFPELASAKGEEPKLVSPSERRPRIRHDHRTFRSSSERKEPFTEWGKGRREDS